MGSMKTDVILLLEGWIRQQGDPDLDGVKQKPDQAVVEDGV